MTSAPPQVYARREQNTLLSVRPENIPDELKTFEHWVVWKAVLRKGDKTDKVLYNPKTARPADTTDSRTWSSFDVAYEAYLGNRWHGVGFVFSSGDPFVGIDFDDCRDPESGEVDPDVLKYIEKFEERYVEASVSGTGVHLITRGKLRGGAKRGGREIYGQDRFFAITGEVLDV